MANMTEDKWELTVYEIGYLLLPSIAEEGLSAVVDKIKAVIAKEGGKEIASEDPFKQDLAYTMTKTVGASRYVVNDAYIGWIKFEMEPASVLRVKAEVENLVEILRCLLIKAPRETGFTFLEARKALEAEAREEVGEGSSEEPSPAEETVVE
jgi:ribosomal protein S6